LKGHEASRNPIPLTIRGSLPSQVVVDQRLDRLTQIQLEKWQLTTPQPLLWPFFWDHRAEPVPEENFWTLWCKGRLTEADTLTIGLGTTPSRLTSAHLHHPPIYYRPDALPETQPTVSKH